MSTPRAFQQWKLCLDIDIDDIGIEFKDGNSRVKMQVQQPEEKRKV